MEQGEISRNVQKFYGSISNVKDHRYKSWEHCYLFFQKSRNKELTMEELDLAQLHLAFYLASWGMYRGSSFLLQKDYTVYFNLVKEIFDKKYEILWEIEKNLGKKDEMGKLFLELYSNLETELIKIKRTLSNHQDLDNKSFNQTDVSSILITKIILGTIGCIPAYDRFFISGLGALGMQKKFNKKKSFLSMVSFYSKNKKELDNLRENIEGYSIMKLIDMYFWSLGYSAWKLQIDKIGESL